MFLKVDADPERITTEVEAMTLAPIPTAEILWHKPSVLALGVLPGTALGRLGEPSPASPEAWAAAGAMIRQLHEAPLPATIGPTPDEAVSELDRLCDWLVSNQVLPDDLVERNRRIADRVLRPWAPAFTHGDLQITHIFVEDDQVTGVLDWSEAGQGDPLYDLATLTLGHAECLDDLLVGYGTDVDVEVIRAWWSVRSLQASPWLIEHGFDPAAPGAEFDVLRAAAEMP